MSLFTATTVAIPATLTKTATVTVADFRETGGGSNRTDWARTVVLYAAILTVLRTGKPVDVTDQFAGRGGKPYHQCHRAIGATLFRPLWDQVQVVALKDAQWSGKTVTGITDTVRGTTVLICPTA